MPVINTNTTANAALHYLSNNSDAQSSSVSKIASGTRITKASDDAAGLAVATSLNSDVTVLSMAETNASNASAILQEADGTMSNIADMLQRMRSLATESLSGTVGSTERTYLNAEFQQLSSEIDAISSGTRFNDVSLLDGSGSWSRSNSGVAVLVGTLTTDKIDIKLAVTTTAGTADETSETGLGINTSNITNALVNGSTVDGASSFDVTTTANAQASLILLNSAVDYLSNARAEVGALISRFDFRNETIQTTIENTDTAKSNIEDTDVASEQTNLATEKVKTQAAIAVLSQANSMPSDLLSLLR